MVDSGKLDLSFIQENIVFGDGVATDPSKTVNVANWPETISIKEVQHFLGLTSYFCWFVKTLQPYSNHFTDSKKSVIILSGHQTAKTTFENLRCLLTTYM